MLAVATLLACTPALHAASPITGATIDSVSSEWRSGPDMHADNLINGSGITAGTQTTALADMWETMPYQSSASVAFDLHGRYDVGSFHVWNFNYPNYTGRGVHTLDILTADEDKVWRTPTAYEFAAASGTAGDPWQEFSLSVPWTNTRYSKFDKMVYYGGGDSAGHIGLSEVQFTAAVPEPASLALLVLGGIALLRRRSI